MRGGARKSPAREFPVRLMIHRLIPAILASVSFLVTYTVRSWHEGRWPLGAVAIHADISASRQPSAARSMAIAAPPLKSAAPLGWVLPPKTILSHETLMPAAEPAVATADAPAYPGEMAREANHSSRMH
jgi:hypothetical protein